MPVQLDLSISISRHVRHAGQGAHALALYALSFTTLEPCPRGVLAIAILAAWWHFRRTMAGAHGDVRIRLYRDGGWAISLRAERLRTARLMRPVFVHPSLTVLRFRLDDGSRHSVLLLPDCVDADDFRRLRVWLRYGLAGSD